jgi:hypothetical protein
MSTGLVDGSTGFFKLEDTGTGPALDAGPRMNRS